MGTVNIEWINSNDAEPNVGLTSPLFYIDVSPLSFLNSSFQRMGTTATSDDSDAAPAGTTHALITSVSGSHYIRKSTAPATTTGGICAMAGASRMINISEGQVIKIVTTS